MAFLHSASDIFIDFKTLLFDTDSYVIANIYEAFKDKENHSFTGLIEYLKDNETNLPYVGQVKNSINPLDDFVEDDYEAELCYNEILYNANVEPFVLIDKLVPTAIGKSLLTLMKDENVKNVYVYVDYPSVAICQTIYNFFDKDERVTIIGLGKEDFLQTKEYTCNTYLFENIDDVLYLLPNGKSEETRIVLVPEFSFNVDEETGDILLKDEDDNTISGMQLSEEYNIELSTIAIPLI